MQFNLFKITGQRFSPGWHLLFVAMLSVLFVAASPALVVAAGDWQEKWEATVKGAEKEGSVGVLHAGGASTSMRRLFKEGFEKKYPKIKVKLLVGGGRSLAPRTLAERKAAKFFWDVYIGGTTTAIRLLKPAGAYDPIRPALILPEVIDPSKWFGGKIDFADESASHVLAFGGFVIPPFAYNTNLYKKDEIRSYWDLTDPKWQGKLIVFDPRAPGVGLATATFMWFHRSMGKEFLRKLYSQPKLVLTRGYRQIIEEVGRGNYYVGLGVHQPIFKELKGKGLPLGSVSADSIKEGSYQTAATASVQLMNRAPHPNAAKVYINWLLSKEGQQAYSKASAYWSRRVDISQDHLDQRFIPKAEKYDSYFANYKEQYVKHSGQIVSFLKSVIKR